LGSGEEDTPAAVKISILPSGIRDLAEGRDFYERQAPGLGAYFLDSLFSDIDSLILHGGTHRRIFGYHRLLSRRFPYAIYYRTTDGVIEVWRVLDCRQHPGRIQRALK
jgi:plasmid stabilization system protein ParE